MMRAGELDREITIERKQATQDPTYGTEIVTWVPLVAQVGSPVIAQRFNAQVQDALPSRSESVRMGLDLARNQTRLRMRYRTDIDSSMRVTVHGETDIVYQIVGGPAMIDGRQQFLELMLERYSS
jgi:head-tail adaptor